MTTPLTYLYTGNSLTVMGLDGSPNMIESSHPYFGKVVDLVIHQGSQDIDTILSLMSPAARLRQIADGAEVTLKHIDKNYKIVVDPDNSAVQFTVNGYEFNIPNDLRFEILRVADDNGDITPFSKFLGKLADNPDKDVHSQLFGFIQACGMTLAEDGDFLAYKRVRSDFKDIYSGTMDNSPGKVVEEERFYCEKDPNKTCAKGLHFAAWDYLDSYASAVSNKTVLVKINPTDVVSIPNDYRDMKGRACKYLILREVERDKELKGTAVMKDVSSKIKLQSVEDVIDYLYRNEENMLQVARTETNRKARLAYCSLDDVFLFAVKDDNGAWVLGNLNYEELGIFTQHQTQYKVKKNTLC